MTDVEEIRADHFAVHFDNRQDTEAICDACLSAYPCSTIRLLDRYAALVARLAMIEGLSRRYRRRQGDWAQAIVENHADVAAVERAMYEAADALDNALASSQPGKADDHDN